MRKKDYHIVPRERGWAVICEGAERAASVHDTKAEAVEAGRVLARTHESELVIHGKDGQIQDSDSYGGDPSPPHDTKH